jgi:ABC-type multidrug transport system fused ATPase/permease subunit
LPHGLDTEIGERGVRLSGGQKQRLAIAKIMLKNPEIILLDEPTSALDSMSEELVSQAMQELFKNRTVVIIAHRLQTVKHADKILYIDRGQIVEEGTHEELTKQGGNYAKMLNIQTSFG